jgi:hypothetical protein
MTDMPTAPAHAKPAPRDHLWVLAVIAACALAEVWASWVGIGSVSGFPDLGRVHTDWILAVVMEAYWAYALYAWLAASPGPRSRSFAMWSCGVVFVLSLVGQVSYHEMTAPSGMPMGRRVVVGFVTILPVTVLALIAVLIHLRHGDRADAAEAEAAARKAERDAAEAAGAADERVALRAELEAERAALQPLRDEFGTAQRDLSEALTRADELAQKLAARTAQGKRSRSAQGASITTEFRALDEMEKDPSLRAPGMGAELGRRLGMSPQSGRRLHAKLTARGTPGAQSGERSPEQSGERSDERS